MGLKADITEALTEALATDLLDARSDLAFVSVQGGSYNPGTGVPAATETTYNITGVVEPVSNMAVDGEIVQVGDYKFIILEDDLSVVPRLNDRIVYDGDLYDVNLVKIDPAKVAWEIFARTV